MINVGKESDPSDQNVLNEKTDSTCLVESTTGIFRLRSLKSLWFGWVGSPSRCQRVHPIALKNLTCSHKQHLKHHTHLHTISFRQRNIYSLHSSINHLYRFENSIYILFFPLVITYITYQNMSICTI